MLSQIAPHSLVPKSFLVMLRERYKWHKSFLPELYIRDDGRVNLPHLEADIVHGCNLRCCHCSHFSPYRKGIVPTEEIVRWLETWSKKIKPNKFFLLGGEPFLHPDLETIIIESSRIWNNSTLEIISNGLLIPQVSQNIFNTLKKAKVKVVISDHSGVDVTHEKVTAACTCLKKNEISHELCPSNTVWRIHYKWDENDVLVPFQSSPHSAWSVCMAKCCPTLANNQLYKCSSLASIIESTKEGALQPTVWKDALTYNALTPDADANSILEHFCRDAIKECSVCPDKYILTEAKQML